MRAKNWLKVAKDLNVQTEHKKVELKAIDRGEIKFFVTVIPGGTRRLMLSLMELEAFKTKSWA